MEPVLDIHHSQLAANELISPKDLFIRHMEAGCRVNRRGGDSPFAAAGFPRGEHTRPASHLFRVRIENWRAFDFSFLDFGSVYFVLCGLYFIVWERDGFVYLYFGLFICLLLFLCVSCRRSWRKKERLFCCPKLWNKI